MTTRNLFELTDLSTHELDVILQMAVAPPDPTLLAGRGVAMVFEKQSARTRNATEMAVVALGGHPVMITDAEVGIDTRERAEDVARTLGSFHSVVCARVRDHSVLLRMAGALDEAGMGVPIINLLSDQGHPCQALADLLTLRQHFGANLTGRVITYIGDANNVARSLAIAAVSQGMVFRCAAPEHYQFDTTDAQLIVDAASRAGRGGELELFEDPMGAASGADALYTDVWVSMGQEAEAAERRSAFASYSITDAVADQMSERGIVLHCLPAHRGEEISHAVLEGSRSRVWSQVHHRRTAMIGLFTWLSDVGSIR